MYPQFFKPIIDRLIAAIGLVLLSPILLIVALLIRLKLGSPILFTQVRPGYKGKLFHIYKFRSMLDANDRDGNPLPDSKRLTHFGRILRSTSLDELPELWNVLRGDMSLVGPRPLLTEYLDRYSPEQMRRHDVRPGITGWAQINGRNAISWPEKFALDLWYIENISFLLDLKILWLTVWKTVRRADINQKGQATMQHFMGEK